MRPFAATLLFVLAIAAAGAHAACEAPRDDVFAHAEPLGAPVQPAPCAQVTQTPPAFTWPARKDAQGYALQLTFPDGHVERRTAAANWLLWNAALPPGTYEWRVEASGPQAVRSAARRFTIARDAVAFVVPTGEEAARRARATKRPRTWPHDAASPFRALRAERKRDFQGLREEADRHLKDAVQAEPASGSIESNYEDTVAEQKRTLNSAFAWFGSNDDRYAHDATRRMAAMSGWRTDGKLAPATNDMGNRTVAWTLALGYDWMREALDDKQRAAILAAIRARTQPMVDDVVANLPKEPYDSHRQVTLTTVAAIAALMAGDIPEADEWLRATLPLAAIWTSAWGGPDGGYANGTMQMLWDDDSDLLPWYVLRNAAGLDLAKGAWMRHHASFYVQFLPPGTPAGVFGDGAEMPVTEIQARVAKAFAAFAPSPLARWYASRLSGEDGTRLELLLAPPFDAKAVPMPRGVPQSAFFPSVGWVAFHADLADPQAASIYFKSSPYGSHNHSHADQNSFVVNDRGRRLMIASGYYDGYGTAHWKDWYKQTRSANAITFDGGQGQAMSDRKYSGAITAFSTHGNWDHAVGHAEAAYAGALTLAQRTLVYLRPKTLLVYDRLASETPRAWEWNLHALHRMREAPDGAVAIENEGARLCLRMLAAPASIFRQTDQFTAAPQGRDRRDEWHGVFAARAKSASAEFVALVRIGADCSTADNASVHARDGGWDVTVDGRTVRLEGERVSVR